MPQPVITAKATLSISGSHNSFRLTVISPSPQPLKSASRLTARSLPHGQPSAVCLTGFGSVHPVVNFQEMGTPDSANATEDRDWFSKSLSHCPVAERSQWRRWSLSNTRS